MKIGQDERGYFAYALDEHLTDRVARIEYWQSKTSEKRLAASAMIAAYIFRDDPERLATFDHSALQMGRFTPDGVEYF